MISWEEFNEKGYYVVPHRPRLGEASPPGSSSSTRTRRSTRSQHPHRQARVLLHRPGRALPRRPGAAAGAQLDPQGRYHEETIGTRAGKKYPLLVMSNHPRWGVHSQHDDITWLREIETCKVKGPDGYQYHPLWMNPVDAEARGIKKGDVVSIYQRAGHGAGRGLCDRAHHAGSGRHRPRGQVRPHRAGGDRPGRGHQHHRAAQHHLQERLRAWWSQRLPGRGGEGRPGGARGQVSRGFRPECHITAGPCLAGFTEGGV